MTWVGLRDRHDGHFAPDGLGLPERRAGAVPEDGLIAVGSLQIETDFTAGQGAVPILHYETEDPWPVRLTLAFDSKGTLLLGHKVGTRSLWLRLPTRLTGSSSGVIVTYGWDAPRRMGVLSLHDPGSGLLDRAEVPAPMPLTMRDARHIAGGSPAARLGAEVTWLALADHLAPIGPMPGLGGETRLALADGGLAPLSCIETGQRLATADGGTAQVRWVGSAEVIARGRQAPLCLRAPFHGLGRDIIVAPDQRLQIGGSDVEYLFGVELVSAAAGHLVDRRSVLPAACGPVQRYWQVMLDRPAAILAEGCAVESLDVGPLLADPAALHLSLLAEVSRDLLPWQAPRSSRLPVLQGFEAMTLACSGAA